MKFQYLYGSSSLILLYPLYTWVTTKPHIPMTKRMLKTAEPTTAPRATEPSVVNNPGSTKVLFISYLEN